MRSVRLLIASLLLVAGLSAHAQDASNPRVRVETNMGQFVIELDPARAPLTVANFLQYVREGFYSGVIFHRVISGFIAQAGQYDEKYVEKKARPPIPNESGNGLSNRRGTVGLARTADPHSGDAQFYLNLADNPLDPQPTRWGYTVFGRVVDGMNVVDAIGEVATGEAGPLKKDAPLKPVIIIRIEEIKSAP
ncbi:MAG TPA: peptidylprolyl isomerase [Steroidobacteraceae bacterium]